MSRTNELPPRSPDAVMLALAGRQHGVVSRRQLLQAGLSTDMLDYRLLEGRLRAVHRGVYHVGPLTVPNTRPMAAVLACGSTAVLSHQTAGVLHRVLQPAPNDDAPMHVTVTHGHPGSRPGLTVHRVTTLRADETSVVDGIPVTTVARTLLDLASVLPARELDRAVAETLALRITQRSSILRLLARHPRRSGAKRLRTLLAGESQPAFARSEAEMRLLSLVRSAHLPEPEANVRVAGYEVDFLWRSERLVLEVDGQAFHSSSRRFESDRLRDGKLLAAGFR